MIHLLYASRMRVSEFIELKLNYIVKGQAKNAIEKYLEIRNLFCNIKSSNAKLFFIFKFSCFGAYD